MARTALLSLLSLGVPFGLGPVGPMVAPAPAPAHRTAATSPTTAEIDAQVWTAVAASVVHGDIVAMGRTYHEMAVLVTKTGTKPIAEALAGWGKGMVTAKRDGDRATVGFRFTNRHDDATTAFEAGIFKYTVTNRAGASTSSYTRLEALLVKTNGRWRTLMERQLDPATESDWNALPR